MPLIHRAVPVFLALPLLLAGHARAASPVPTAWADHTLTRSFEEALHQSGAGKDRKMLADAYTKIEAEGMPTSKKLKALVGDPQWQKSLDFSVNACHMAGLYIRLLVLEAHEDTRASKSAAADRRTSELSDTFAENMGRCERVFKKPRTERLVGRE